MTGWTFLALVPIVLYLAGTTFALRREDAAARRAWWRSVFGDPIAVITGVVVTGTCVTAIAVDGDFLGLPSATLIGVTVAAVVGRVRARRRSATQ